MQKKKKVDPRDREIKVRSGRYFTTFWDWQDKSGVSWFLSLQPSTQTLVQLSAEAHFQKSPHCYIHCVISRDLISDFWM